MSRPLVNLANSAAIVSDTISLNGGYTGLECNLQEMYIFAGIRSQVCGNQRQTNGHTCKLLQTIVVIVNTSKEQEII